MTRPTQPHPPERAGLASRLRANLGGLSAGERKVARALLTDFPVAALGSAADLAATAGVSAPTVVRCARRLGFSGYADLQNAVLSELSERAASPSSQFDHRPSSNWLGDGLDAIASGVSALAEIPSEEFETAAGLLADTRYSIAAFGGRYSGLVARYLTLHLQQVRPRVRAHDPQLGAVSEFLDAGGRDVFVVYDFRRYQRSTISQAERVAAAGAKLICITDPWLSPVAEHATVVLPVSVRSASPFDSSAAALVLSELLAGAVLQLTGERARERMRRWDAAQEADFGDDADGQSQ
ncbi:MAG: MurR/RpiR family transcriptional regulator [Nocardioides sp.]|uniref:MurR/RpiR family transcriptional regulator n=1 Tax=Nocardioides sp. TaxID=35761 RepID=UPI0039E5F4D4